MNQVWSMDFMHDQLEDGCSIRLFNVIDDYLKRRTAHMIFTFSNGYQPSSLNGSFRRLMRDGELEKNCEGQTHTLHSLRHTYATLELIESKADLYTLAKQMD
jgi:integrase